MRTGTPDAAVDAADLAAMVPELTDGDGSAVSGAGGGDLTAPGGDVTGDNWLRVTERTATRTSPTLWTVNVRYSRNFTDSPFTEPPEIEFVEVQHADPAGLVEKIEPLRDLATHPELADADYEAVGVELADTAGAFGCFEGADGETLERREALWSAGAAARSRPGRLPGIVDRFEKRRECFSDRAEAQVFFDMHALPHCHG